ncbi:MAG: CehA/McbA family metallohydrolase [Anaerolineae bacterium]|nr:CehA/McbA family metallohydrolase [Anaerolineae bacterium]
MMHEYAGNLHIHTRFSDGEKWHREVAHDAARAGLDFIVVTDHNVWVRGVEGYYEFEQGPVLLLTGEEVHDTRRQPQANHFLVYGAEQEMSPHAPEPQRLIDATNAAGGCGFIAHPYEEELPFFPEGGDLGWHNWEVDGYTGLEIWNYMSSFKNEVSRHLGRLRWQNGLYGRASALPLALHPERYITGPEPEALARWDELLSAGRRIAAIGNSDAHGTPMHLGPITREIFPYEFLFRAVNTHVLLRQPLTGDVETDKALILGAVAKGNSWVAYDMAHPTKGFRFSGQGVTKGVMGDNVVMDVGATLQVLAPARASIRLIHNGAIVASTESGQSLTHAPAESGAYRAECSLLFEGHERGWIYSNPIYLD